MRLLVVSQYFWPENFRINDMVAEMVRRGHQVTVLTGVPNYPEGNVFSEYREEPSRFTAYAGAHIVRVPMLARGRGAFRLLLNYLSYALSSTFLGLWRLRGEKFDAIFVCQLSPVTVGIPGAVFRAIKHAPLVMWVLDLWPDTLQAIGVVRSEVLLRLVGKLVGWIYRRCDLILVQSRAFIPLVRMRAGVSKDIEYFPSWAEALFDGENIEPAAEIDTVSDKFTVMFAGNIGEAQDFPAILSAAEQLKEHAHIRWLLLGDGRIAAWVRQEIEVRGLAHCVHLLGRYPVERMPAFFQHADALLVSLKDEPIFGMTIPGKLQSYLASGIPVLAMLNGEGAFVLKNAGAGMVCAAGDHQDLAANILKLEKMSKSERRAMGRKGQNLYHQEFNREILMGKLEAWLLLLSRRNA